MEVEGGRDSVHAFTARMKSGLDGLADALKIDDKRFTTLAARVSTDNLDGFEFVRVRIFQEQKN